MKTQTNKAIGMAIKEFRVRRGYSQEALADRAGLDRSYISLVERGMRSPSLRVGRDSYEILENRF